jgi:hypothetical protein
MKIFNFKNVLIFLIIVIIIWFVYKFYINYKKNKLLNLDENNFITNYYMNIKTNKRKFQDISSTNKKKLSIEEYYQLGVYPSTYKIIAFGDVHGDYYATLKCLQKAKIIDKKLNWCCGNAHVVQMGDILDRKIRHNQNPTDEDSEFKIINLFLKLMKQSFKAGGGFHCIFGNHEFMNVIGNFNYVSDAGINHFRNGKTDRAKFFQPNSTMAKLFATFWNPIIKIGKYLFCHAGISSEIAYKYKIPQINKYMRDFLLGNDKLMDNKNFDELFLNENGIIWSREYSDNVLNKSKIKNLLSNYNCEFMVVGHTIQNNGINLKNDSIWFIDTGMSEAFGKRYNDNKIQVLIIIENGKKVFII